MKITKLLVIFLTLLIFTSAHFKYIQSALEPDEGAYAYAAQELIRGQITYKDFFDHKPPGIYIIYSFIFKFIGVSTLLIKASATIAIILNSILIYFIAKRILSKKHLSLAASLLYLFSMSLPFIDSGYANTEIFMTVFILTSTILIINNKNNKIIALSGFFIGISLIIKQVAIANFLATVIWLKLFQKKKIPQLITYFLGFITPVCLITIYFYKKGALNNFAFANIIYNQAYINHAPLPNRIMSFPLLIVLENPAIWIFGILGSFLILKNIYKTKNTYLVLISINLLFSFLLLQYLGLGTTHYYQQLTPFLIISTVYFISSCYSKKYLRPIIIYIIIISVANSLFIFYSFVLTTPTNKLQTVDRPYFRGDWGDQSLDVARAISKYAKPGDYIYNLGRESQLYFYTGTRSSSKYFYDRPFQYFPQAISQTCRDLAINKPKLIVNTLKPPYFPPAYEKHIWSKINKCAKLEIYKVEKINFAEIWLIR